MCSSSAWASAQALNLSSTSCTAAAQRLISAVLASSAASSSRWPHASSPCSAASTLARISSSASSASAQSLSRFPVGISNLSVSAPMRSSRERLASILCTCAACRITTRCFSAMIASYVLDSSATFSTAFSTAMPKRNLSPDDALASFTESVAASMASCKEPWSDTSFSSANASTSCMRVMQWFSWCWWMPPFWLRMNFWILRTHGSSIWRFTCCISTPVSARMNTLVRPSLNLVLSTYGATIALVKSAAAISFGVDFPARSTSMLSAW
mmetsp:Transcript_47596/g.95890  ORF Transcript_47596/g.95890 Transcript_47596/m.95890 type:complete len:269 (-) Transcript_47596:2175-2981(-)